MEPSASEWDNTPIAQCQHCHQSFSMRELLEDPSLFPVGMCFADAEGARNEIHFEHRREGCGFTFAVSALAFATAVEEPLIPEVPIGSSDCQRLCFDISNHHECEHECLYAPFRRFLVSLAEAKKPAR